LIPRLPPHNACIALSRGPGIPPNQRTTTNDDNDNGSIDPSSPNYTNYIHLSSSTTFVTTIDLNLHPTQLPPHSQTNPQNKLLLSKWSKLSLLVLLVSPTPPFLPSTLAMSSLFLSDKHSVVPVTNEAEPGILRSQVESDNPCPCYSSSTRWSPSCPCTTSSTLPG